MIKIIQGESGSQSRSDGKGAMSGGAWTPMRQAKQCLRHGIADLITGAYIASGFKNPNGSFAYAYWNSTPLMSTSFEGTISFQISAIKGEPRIVDLLSGKIYEIPANMIEEKGTGYLIKNVPVTDYPLLLMFGDIVN